MKKCILAFLPTKHRFIVLIVLQIVMPINRKNFLLYYVVLPSKVSLVLKKFALSLFRRLRGSVSVR